MNEFKNALSGHVGDLARISYYDNDGRVVEENVVIGGINGEHLKAILAHDSTLIVRYLYIPKIAYFYSWDKNEFIMNPNVETKTDPNTKKL